MSSKPASSAALVSAREAFLGGYAPDVETSHLWLSINTSIPHVDFQHFNHTPPSSIITTYLSYTLLPHSHHALYPSRNRAQVLLLCSKRIDTFPGMSVEYDIPELFPTSSRG